MASIRCRGPHQHQVMIRKAGYPPQSKTFETDVEARAWAAMIESEMARGIWISRSEAESTSLAEALNRYAIEISANKKGASAESYVIKMLASLDLAHRKMATIRSSDIARLRDEWLEIYKPATVLRRLAVLSHVFAIARREWGMESLTNPVDLVRKPRPNNARTRRIAAGLPNAEAPGDEESESDRGAQDGELERVAKASGSALLPSIICLAVETAMRRGEIVSLRWEHVDLKRRVARLPSTKNGDARDVPLSTRAIGVLEKLQAGRKSGRVFVIRSDAVTRAFERAVKRARARYEKECAEENERPDERFLVDLRFHDLRHEATSRLAEIFAMHELTKITGHKDPRMLIRYYHPRAEDLAKRLA